MSGYGTSVVKRLSKAQADELDSALLSIAEQEKPTSVRGMYYMAMGADLKRKQLLAKRPYETLRPRRQGMITGEGILGKIFCEGCRRLAGRAETLRLAKTVPPLLGNPARQYAL